MKAGFLFGFLGLVGFFAVSASAAEIRLDEIIRLAELNDHRIAAGEMAVNAAESAKASARAAYLPRLDFEAIDSTGFPGSSGALGIRGLMGSSYRKGASAGLVAQANLWDFGRTAHTVRAAGHDARAAAADGRLTRLNADLEAARLYFLCVRNRSESENWAFVLDQSKLVADEVRRYVRTGQRSIVEKYLVESQVEEALTGRSDFDQRKRLTLDRLGILTGVDFRAADCPPVEGVSKLAEGFESPSREHPYLARAEANAEAESERLQAARAGYLPKLVAVGSFGALEDTRLVPKKDYAVGVGLIFPLFDGFRTSAEVDRARAVASEKSFLVEAERDRIAQTNAKYDEIIEASRARLTHLVPELKLAREGFEVAKRRYFRFQGVLVDVREAMRNLSRTESSYDETRLDFIEGTIAKAIFNGGRARSLGKE